jgi:hypothetical protein
MIEANKTTSTLSDAHEALKKEMKKLVDRNVALTQENTRLSEVCVCMCVCVCSGFMCMQANADLETALEDPKVFQQHFIQKGIDMSADPQLKGWMSALWFQCSYGSSVQAAIAPVDAEIFFATPNEQIFNDYKQVVDENRDLRRYIDRMLAMVMMVAPSILEHK